MFQYVLCYHANSLRSHHNLFTVNIPNHFVSNFFICTHCFVIFHMERQNIFIIYSIKDSIPVKLVAECLLCGKKFRIFHLIYQCVLRKNRGSGKSEQIIFFEALYNSRMHIPELTSVTLIKNNDHVFTIYFMSRILFYKSSQFLNGRNNNMCVRIFQLSF